MSSLSPPPLPTKPPLGPDGKPQSWIADRIGWTDLTARATGQRIPRRSFIFYLGGITLFLLLVQVVSGILLVLYYRPDPAHAHESVEQIMGEIPYGDLIRAVHAWASDGFIAVLFAHLFTVVIRRSFKPPHELTWLSGLFALFVGVGMAFTGAVLPWTESAYTHARVGSQLAGNMPFIGDWLRRFMRGGDEVSLGTLTHAFGFHVAALPALITVLVAGHLFFLSRKPIVRPDAAEHKTLALYPEFIVRQAAAQTGVLVIIMTLAIFVERPLGPVANVALSTPAGARPPWYLLPIHAIVRDAPTQLLGMEGPRFLMGAAGFVALLVAAIPFLDRRGAKLTAWLAWGALLVLLLLAVHALN